MTTASLTCPTCSTPFARTHGRQRYCNPACRQDTHKKYPTPCTRCGKVAMKYPSNRYKQFCGTPCRDAHLRETTKARHANRPAKPPYDPRSPLRRAYEDGNYPQVIRELSERTARNEDGCWVWQATIKDGYPIARWSGKDIPIHRVSLESKLQAPLWTQPAHHMCANTSCVNPDHLQPVTHRDNIAEMLARNYMVNRIQELEDALRAIHPSHPLLEHVSVPR